MFFKLNKLYFWLQGECKLYHLYNYFSLRIGTKSNSVIKLDNNLEFSSFCIEGHSLH